MILDENQEKEFQERGFLVLKNFVEIKLCDEILQKAKFHLENKIAPIESEHEYLQTHNNKNTIRRLRQVTIEKKCFKAGWKT